MVCWKNLQPDGRQIWRQLSLTVLHRLLVGPIKRKPFLREFSRKTSMAEIGAIASIIGVAGAGAKLSIVLFEFASTVGSAGLEVRQIGIDISLFCSVLKQLQSTLTKAKAYRYSISAIETTQEILDRCKEVFGEIEEILRSLQKGERDPSAEPSVDLIARVKWTFMRSKVQVLRATLESCKITLHIMLTTLEFAQKIATRR